MNKLGMSWAKLSRAGVKPGVGIGLRIDPKSFIGPTQLVKQLCFCCHVVRCQIKTCPDGWMAGWWVVAWAWAWAELCKI